MKRFTTDNFSTAFQLVIVALLFIYAAFPGKSVVVENATVNNLLIDKIKVTHLKVKQYSFKNRLYSNNAVQDAVGNKIFTWIMPGTKSVMNTDTELTGAGSVSTQINK